MAGSAAAIGNVPRGTIKTGAAVGPYAMTGYNKADVAPSGQFELINDAVGTSSNGRTVMRFERGLLPGQMPFSSNLKAVILWAYSRDNTQELAFHGDNMGSVTIDFSSGKSSPSSSPALIAHAVFLSLAFFLLMPSAILIARLFLATPSSLSPTPLHLSDANSTESHPSSSSSSSTMFPSSSSSSHADDSTSNDSRRVFWFTWHMYLQVAALVCICVGCITAFVSSGSQGFHYAHAWIGVFLLVLLVAIQPLVVFFRPSSRPSSSDSSDSAGRWHYASWTRGRWRVVHWLVGVVGVVFGWFNCFLGLTLYSKKFAAGVVPQHPLYPRQKHVGASNRRRQKSPVALPPLPSSPSHPAESPSTPSQPQHPLLTIYWIPAKNTSELQIAVEARRIASSSPENQTAQALPGKGWFSVGWSQSGAMYPGDAVVANQQRAAVAAYSMTGHDASAVRRTNDIQLGKTSLSRSGNSVIMKGSSQIDFSCDATAPPPASRPTSSSSPGQNCKKSTLQGYQYQTSLQGSSLLLHWKEAAGKAVDMAVEAKSGSPAKDGWMSLGWSNPSGRMVPSDAVIGNLYGGEIYAYKVPGYSVGSLSRDGFDIGSGASTKTEGGSIVMRFTRTENTGWSNKFKLSGKNSLIWAYSSSSNTLGSHGRN
ncbi:unnamed protein product, partial [Closterium sp. Naga37s-1]